MASNIIQSKIPHNEVYIMFIKALLHLAPYSFSDITFFYFLSPFVIFFIRTDPMLFPKPSTLITQEPCICYFFFLESSIPRYSYDSSSHFRFLLKITLKVKHFLTTPYKIAMLSPLQTLFDFFQLYLSSTYYAIGGS